MKRFVIIFLVFGALCVSFPPILTSGEQHRNYASLKLGAYFPQSDDLEDFDEGFNGEIGFGHYYTPNFAVEWGFGYFQTDATFAGTDASLGSFVEKDEISVVPVTLTGKGIYPAGKFELFAEAGVGFYYVEGEFDISSSALGNISLNEYDTVFGYHIGVGAGVNITPTTVLGIECKYLIAEADFGAAIQGVPLRMDTDLDGFLITITLANRFDFY